MDNLSLRKRLALLASVSMIPLVLVAAYLIFALRSYSNDYDAIVSNMEVANQYNLKFKEAVDENLYKIVVSGASFETIGDDPELSDPYDSLREIRESFSALEEKTQDIESRNWLNNLLRNVNTLELRIGDIERNLSDGSHYDANIQMLNDNVYILTELIQDDIQYYLYYQTMIMQHMKTELRVRVRYFVVFIALLLVFIVGVLLLIVIHISRSITVPVERLGYVAQEISHGNLQARADCTSGDEISQLGERINDMAESLEKMMQQIRDDEKKMRNAELRLLQEQINPHFLYNTMDTIIWLIEGRKLDEAEDMLVSLSNFFRLVLSHGHEYISIREEEQHIRSYLEIQQFRYHDILEYEISMDPLLYEYRILKMTLQPLVENALYHGIKNKRDKGMIRITGELGDKDIVFTVSDDGIGMDSETLEKLRVAITKPCKDTDSGFGMANVNERIRMNFGPEYGLTLDSEPGGGTKVTVRIPRETAEKSKVEELVQ
ncbi:sensor histidine kinase [Oribacterium sp. WCC10]|uniref:sensor histidine kinase n=1 Tax=Oribacterium sp. WCC10 TaxID=1855343 RepID=UPI0008E6DD2D|nr:sensor histidine kinase [Oribacterium sp. WCC10]SFG30593.1 two-component system, sensor histidine kinase YesM [Oribacterium sp. WCC10]